MRLFVFVIVGVFMTLMSVMGSSAGYAFIGLSIIIALTAIFAFRNKVTRFGQAWKWLRS